jgi:Ca2+/H+ antiporter, TMEM165/GDT1 family
MDALLIALVSGLLAEVGARTQMMAQALSAAFKDATAPVLSLFAILVVSLIVSAVGGLLVRDAMPPDATILMMGLALGFAGIGQFRRIKPAPDFTGKPAFLTSLWRLGGAHIADGTPFLAFAIAARTGNAPLTLVGSMIAVLVLCLPALLIPQDWTRPALFLRLRRIGGAILLVSGIWCALTALRII